MVEPGHFACISDRAANFLIRRSLAMGYGNFSSIRAVTVLKIEEIFQVISINVKRWEHSLMTWENLRVLKLWPYVFFQFSRMQAPKWASVKKCKMSCTGIPSQNECSSNFSALPSNLFTIMLQSVFQRIVYQSLPSQDDHILDLWHPVICLRWALLSRVLCAGPTAWI